MDIKILQISHGSKMCDADITTITLFKDCWVWYYNN